VRGGARRGAGRPPIKIDLNQLENLCALGLPVKHLAAYFGVSVRTIESRCRKKKFRAAMARGSAMGYVEVLAEQRQMMKRGNAPMAIWRGKQFGQRDFRPIEFSAPPEEEERFGEAFDEIVSNINKDPIMSKF
jgi:hypothetical protein